MKIVFVPQRDFDQLWSKLPPCDRMRDDSLPCINLCLPHKGMLVIPEDWYEVVRYECPAGSEFTLEAFFRTVGIGRAWKP